MEFRRLGRTGLLVSRMGVGMAEAGFNLEIEDMARVKRLIDIAERAGINFLDTAACYGLSEEQIGKAISGRRNQFILATKAAYVEEDSAHRYDPSGVRQSIDRSLKKLGVDHVDVLQLHSCSIEVMERGDAVEALRQARQDGKVRYIGYSGDNEQAMWAAKSGIFDTLQTSFNLVDQRARESLFGVARAQEMGVIVKRPIANRVWGKSETPFTYRHVPEYAAEYVDRASLMAGSEPLDGAPDDDVELALGFVMAHDEVDVAIVGTANPDHLSANVGAFESGSLVEDEVVGELHSRFAAVGTGWVQVT